MIEQRDIMIKYKQTYDLEDIVFTFKGKSIPGSSLAILLGLTEESSKMVNQTEAVRAVAESGNGKPGLIQCEQLDGPAS